jgi:spore coat protein U-like protein
MRRLALALLLGLLPAAAAAQGVAVNGTITANVIGGSITFNNLQDINFGTVPRGVSTTVLRNAAGAAKVQVTGSSNAFAQIRFTLPAQLPNIQALPGVNMPITFSATSAGWNRDSDDPGGGTAFNPAVGVNNARFGPPPRPYLYVYLGGTVTPSPTQAPGIYQGSIILTITYL